MSGVSSSLRRFGWLVHLVVAASVLGFIFHGLDWRDIASHLMTARPEMLALAGLFVLGDSLIRIWNWRQVLQGVLQSSPGMFRRLTACYFSGSFIGTVVPSTAGTDALRAMFATNMLGGHLAMHAAPLLTLNVLGLMAGCVVGLVGIATLLTHTFPAWYLGGAAILLFGLLAATSIGFLALKYQRGLLLGLLRRMGRRWFWLRRIGRKFLGGMTVFSRRQVRFVPVFAVTIVSQLARAAMFTLVAGALGLQLPLGAWLLLTPLTGLSGLLPISVAGFGGDQAALVYLLAPFGVDASQAVAISLTMASLWLAGNVVYGGLAFVLSSRVLRSLLPVTNAG